MIGGEEVAVAALSLGHKVAAFPIEVGGFGDILAEKFADFFLRGDIEPDGGFVEKEHSRLCRSAVRSVGCFLHV